MQQTWNFRMVSIPTYPHHLWWFIGVVLSFNHYQGNNLVISTRNFWARQHPIGNAPRVLRGTSGGNVRIAYPGTVPVVGCRRYQNWCRYGLQFSLLCMAIQFWGGSSWLAIQFWGGSSWLTTNGQSKGLSGYGYLGMEYWNILGRKEGISWWWFSTPLSLQIHWEL